MKYFIDTEFLEGTQKERNFFGQVVGETKPTIDLISIGIVAEDGREYYAISKDFNLKEAWNRYDLEINKRFPLGGEYNKVYWIRENVLKNLFNNSKYSYYKGINSFKDFKKLINHFGKTNKQIAKEIKEFVYKGHVKEVEIGDDKPRISNKGLKVQLNPENKFYAYYADYDWVAFCWLFGKMIDLPKGFPMYCVDLKQELDNKDNFRPIIWKNNKNINLLKKHPNYPKQTNEHNALADAKWNKELYKFLNKL